MVKFYSDAKKIFLLFILFFKAKKEFNLIIKKDILILDEVGSNKIIDLLLSNKKNCINIFEDRGRKINIPILLKSIKYIFKYKHFSYKYNYIKESGAKVAITFIDTNHHYCKIFHKVNHCKLIFIQNGRGASYRYFGYKKNSLKTDYYFVNSKAFISYSSMYINSNYILIGSILANIFPKSLNKKVKKISWVSQYKKGPYIFPNRTYQFKDIVYKSTYFYLKLVLNFCIKNNLKLEVLGVTDSNFERNFYKKISNKIKFIKKTDDYLSSYKALSRDSIIIGMDSQLIYESFALGYRTAFFSRNIFAKDNSWSFGWPDKYNNSGFFYTNRPDTKIVNNILYNLINVSNSNWKILQNKYSKSVMNYDYKNTITKNILQSLL